jgi:predicted dehydrogenase
MKMNSTMKRRTFLNTAGKGLAAGFAAPYILSSCSNGANSNIHIGHIGVGSMGSGVLHRWLMPTTGTMNVAACDPFQDRRDRAAQFIDKTYKDKEVKAPKCQAYLDLEELLERKDIDAVAITTPDHWHVPAAIKAARAGKHILLAKPLGLSYPNYKILEKEVAASGVTLHYGTQQRAQEHMKVAVGMIKEGKIGKIEHVEAWAPGKNPVESPQCHEVPVPNGFDFDKWTGPAPLNSYCPERVTNNASWFQWDYSIGFLGGWGAHPLDIMIWALKDQMDGEYTCEGTGTFWEPGGIYNNVYSWDVNYAYKSGIKLRFMSTDVVEAKDVWSYRNAKEGNTTTFFGEKGMDICRAS